MKKKKKRKKIKVRQSWGIDPSTQVHKVDTDYSRSRLKKELKRELDDLDNSDY